VIVLKAIAETAPGGREMDMPIGMTFKFEIDEHPVLAINAGFK
jgi:hypothetical protein